MPTEPEPDPDDAAAPRPRRLFVLNAGFFTGPRVRRILALAGWQLAVGGPGPGDAVGVWGASPTAWRGRALAARTGAPVVTVEDAFLRSVLPGRDRSRIGRRGPIGLLIDPEGLHFDPATPSRIETLAASPEAAARAAEAAEALARLRAAGLSKYNAHRPDVPAPAPGYVLVVDQTRGDASLGRAGRETFLRMLTAARDEHPGARIVVRSHPETAAGHRPGHLGPADLRLGETLDASPVSPWALVANARAVYAVSSQMGYEALLAGHRPRLFGQPFYAGWGLSDDETPLPRRRGRTTVEALFAASHLLAPVWYDPCRDRLTDFEGALRQIEAEARAYAFDRDGHLAYGMRLWKRPAIAAMFGEGAGVRFTRRPSDKVTLVWANRADEVARDGQPASPPSRHVPRAAEQASARRAVEAGPPHPPGPKSRRVPHTVGTADHQLHPPVPLLEPGEPVTAPAIQQVSHPRATSTGAAPAGTPSAPPSSRAALARVEDGFLRSRGLGAALVPPLSLVADDLGIYYDPTRESRLERLIAAPLPPGRAARAAALIDLLRAAGVTKYNLAGALPALPRDGRLRILVPGQVEDDASIRLGAGAERTNLSLLRRVRAENPQALIVWKPHPDVEAGLRPGAIGAADLAGLADVTAAHAPAAELIDAVDAVWTITSTLGFEALLRGKPVTTLGAPFYAGWGLTCDLGPVPARRRARVDLRTLVHAALIAYPRYRDPVSGLPCPVEVALDRLADDALAPQGRRLRLLAKLQGALAGHSWLWR
ncbi:capsular polysaccharide biosynthesis protein [Paracoccus sanguinis]|uniref:Capsule polysaccharide biosynthesis protein n=1 Tax=Paracoccus sanguinis TaxID=1545044 RepID=A0A1H2WTA3_9RHOB|nr:capsular polysaccharide biosynthesis protein [Paracoccus sanguinis]KGJ16354.1 capsular biosynthesis protein [Paracoccus sanguinis]SDW83706.1 Capsule polysaccharide biosynthesis protein [Paracoccus sanguinis]